MNSVWVITTGCTEEGGYVIGVRRTLEEAEALAQAEINKDDWDDREWKQTGLRWRKGYSFVEIKEFDLDEVHE